MLYALVRPVAKAGFKVFFRHIHVHGLENIPAEGPLLIAANHPTAFVEPCVAACFQHRTLHFIVRGDIFKKPLYIKLLKALHLIPIFRFKDGFSNLKQNQETFKYVNQVLNERKAIFILAEGRTIQEKKLRPIQKGPARMAFGALEEFAVSDTKIVPIGFTYEEANVWRRDVMIQCGKPISIADFIDEYRENPNQAIQSVTDEIAARLSEHIVIINNTSDEPVCDALFEISNNERKHSVLPVVIRNNSRLKSEQNLASAYNNLNESEKNSLSKNVVNYQKLLNKHRIKDRHVGSMQKLPPMINIFLLSLVLLLCLPGAMYFFIPVMTARLLASKKVYVKEFQAPVLFALSAFFVLLWCIFSMISGLYLFGIKAFAILLVLLMMGFVSVPVFEEIQSQIQQIRFNSLGRELKGQIRNERNKILNWIRSNY